MSSADRYSNKLYQACESKDWRTAQKLANENVGISFVVSDMIVLRRVRLDISKVLTENAFFKDDVSGFNILQVAVKNNCPVDVAKALIRKGLKPTAKTKCGEDMTSLHLAANRNVSVPLFKLLVGISGKGNQRNMFGRTPMHCIDYRNISAPLYEAMIEAGCDVNGADVNGRTPIMYAVQKSSPPFVVFLLKQGADPLRKDKNGQNAITIASMNGNRHLALLLSSYVCMVVICSARFIPRIGCRQAFIKLLPSELLLKLKTFLFS